MKSVNEKLKSGGYDPVESIEVNFRPDEQDLKKCYSLGERVASMVKAG